MGTLYTVKSVGLLILLFACGLEIQRDLADGFESFKLHHGITMYALAQIVTTFAEFRKLKNELVST